MRQGLLDAVEALGGIEEAARRLREARRAIAARTPEERSGVRVVERADAGEAVPAEEIQGLLASAPARGLFALERATFDPAVPAETVRTILSDAFGDARVTPETKADLLWRYNHVPPFRDAALADLRGPVPFCLLDSEEGRRFHCLYKLPGHETVRCSSPVLYARIRKYASREWLEGKVPFGPVVRDAVEADEPARLMMSLAVEGRKPDLRLLCAVLRLRGTRILDWLMENDAATKRWLDPRRLLFYAAANWPLADIAALAEASERKQPGIVASCVDAFGRNLLWYAFAYHRLVSPRSCAAARTPAGQAEEAEALLVRLGADPDAPTKWGASWRQVARAREERSWDHDVLLDGRPAAAEGRSDCAGWIERFDEPLRADWGEHRVRIVQRGTGLASEWAFPAKRFPRIEQAHLWIDRRSVRDDGDTIVVEFGYEPDPDRLDRPTRRALFRRGPDRLFRFASPSRPRGCAAETDGH